MPPKAPKTTRRLLRVSVPMPLTQLRSFLDAIGDEPEATVSLVGRDLVVEGPQPQLTAAEWPAEGDATTATEPVAAK